MNYIFWPQKPWYANLFNNNTRINVLSFHQFFSIDLYIQYVVCIGSVEDDRQIGCSTILYSLSTLLPSIQVICEIQCTC